MLSRVLASSWRLSKQLVANQSGCLSQPVTAQSSDYSSRSPSFVSSSRFSSRFSSFSSLFSASSSSTSFPSSSCSSFASSGISFFSSSPSLLRSFSASGATNGALSREYEFEKKSEGEERQHQSSSQARFSWMLPLLAASGYVLISTFANGTMVFASEEKEEESVEAGQSSDTAASDDESDEGAAASEDQPKKKEKKKYDKYKYVIVGLGAAGYHAYFSIRARDPEASILVVDQESHLPYDRPPLSKDIWDNPDPEVAKKLEFINWEGEKLSIFYSKEGDFEAPTRYLQGRSIIGLHPIQHYAVLDDWEIIEYEKLLLATGATPRLLDAPEAIEDRVTAYRGIEDFQLMDTLTRSQQPFHVTVVGGMLLGSELARSLSSRPGVKVTLVVSGEGVLSRYLPKYLCDEVTKRIRDIGVEVRASERVEQLAVGSPSDKEGAPPHVVVNLSSGASFETDHVICALGVDPNSDLAVDGKLETDPKTGAIMVNSELQTSVSDIYAAGDAISFFDRHFERRRRIEHFEHAVYSGQLAGFNMANPEKPMVYDHEPIWMSPLAGKTDLVGVGYVSGFLETVSVWEQVPDDEPDKFKKGIIYYLLPDVRDRKRIVGVLLWNLPERIESARKVIRSSSCYIKDIEDCFRKIPLYAPPTLTLPPPTPSSSSSSESDSASSITSTPDSSDVSTSSNSSDVSTSTSN